MLGKGKKWNVKLMPQKDEAYFRVQIFLIKKNELKYQLWIFSLCDTGWITIFSHL